MALNIALCDDIMGMIGHTVKARRGMAKCLKKIKGGGYGLEPHEGSYRLAGVVHPPVREHQVLNLITGEISTQGQPNDFWSTCQDIGDVVGADGNDNFEYMSRGEFDESILYRWSEYDWSMNYEDSEPDALDDPSLYAMNYFQPNLVVLED
jgi:hypothetical protein